MRLCFIANPESVHTQRWVRYFAAQGHEVHLIGERAAGHALPPEVTLHLLPRQVTVRKLRFLFWIVAVRRLVRRLQPDILHAHQVARAGWLGAAAGWHPLVVTAWGSDLLLWTRHSLLQRLLAGWVLRQADYVTCVSDELAARARVLGADPRRLEVLPWGVDREVFRPGPADEALRTQLGLGKGPVVLSLRAIRPVYNPLDIAGAIPSVLAQVPEAQFVIRTYAYDPALLDEFQARVRAAGAVHAVHYVGHLPDDAAIAALYRLSVVAVSVPASDGIPQSVLEALACGVVPVLSDLPSLREWVRHEQEGLFVAVGDVAGLAAGIVRLLRDETLRDRLRAGALRLSQDRADGRVWMARSAALYRRLSET